MAKIYLCPTCAAAHGDKCAKCGKPVTSDDYFAVFCRYCVGMGGGGRCFYCGKSITDISHFAKYCDEHHSLTFKCRNCGRDTYD